MGEQAIAIETLNQLRYAFSSSDLPIMIDIVDWHTISPEFQAIIQTQCEPLIN